MRLVIGLLAGIGLNFGAGSAARADAPPEPTASATVPAPTAAEHTPTKIDAPSSAAAPSARDAAPPTAATVSATAAAATDASRLSAVELAEDKRLQALGYRPEMRNGTRFYCRREAPLGSRFEHKICTTAQQHSDLRQDSKDLLEGAQRTQLNPTGH
jgi:hypothetical protein